MNASAISDALRALVAGRQPVFIWGGPGVGKSAVVGQLAEALKIPLQDVRARLLDPLDLRGLPFLGSDGRSKWATPEFLPQDGTGILFLDELNAAPAMVQAGRYQLVLDRKLGEYKLPEGWAIVAAIREDASGRSLGDWAQASPAWGAAPGSGPAQGQAPAGLAPTAQMVQTCQEKCSFDPPKRPVLRPTLPLFVHFWISGVVF